jgi:hypothetical protein
MEGERRRRQVLHRQARGLAFEVFSHFKREADAGMPVYDVAKTQGHTTEACDISIELLGRATSQFVSLSARHPPSFVSATLEAGMQFPAV